RLDDAGAGDARRPDNRRVPHGAHQATSAELRSARRRRAVRSAVRDAAGDRPAEVGLVAEIIADAAEEALGRGAFLAGFSVAEFLEQLLLLGAHPGRRFYQYSLDQVAAAAAVEHSHAGAAMAQLLARLHARRDLHLDLVAVDSRQADRSAERS